MSTVRDRGAIRRFATAPGPRHWPLARVFTVGATLGVVLVVVAVAVGVAALTAQGRARTALTDVASPALITAQELSVALLDQETGVRGYELSSRPEFLDPYRAGLAAEQRAAAMLRDFAAVGRLGRLAADVDRVTAAAQRWRTEFAEPALADGPTADPVRGRALFMEVRADLTALVDGLAADRVAARELVGTTSNFFTAVSAAVTAVLVAFLVATGLVLRRAVLAPMSQLAAQVREVVSGDGQRHVAVAGPREIVELGTDVEAMRLRILGDLDAVQEANRRLDVQARDLERSNRDLEQFAYVASHDLQEPLRKVSSFAQLLQRRYGGQLDDRADQYIEFAVDGAQRMQRLINDLLAFSRVGSNADDFVPVSLGDVAAAAAAQLESARSEVDGRIVVGELPTVPGDAVLLRQMLFNLIGNGLKFHREGVAPVVEVSAVQAGDEWELVVADNGIGIDPEFADKVFVIFQRLHARDVYPGTGIGLALAKKIAEFHNGRIGVLPPDAVGARVRVTLPAVQHTDNGERPA